VPKYCTLRATGLHGRRPFKDCSGARPCVVPALRDRAGLAARGDYPWLRERFTALKLNARRLVNVTVLLLGR
jgi:hypothetical protein